MAKRDYKNMIAEQAAAFKPEDRRGEERAEEGTETLQEHPDPADDIIPDTSLVNLTTPVGSVPDNIENNIKELGLKDEVLEMADAARGRKSKSGKASRSFYISNDIYTKLNSVSKGYDLSMSEILEMILRKYL